MVYFIEAKGVRGERAFSTREKAEEALALSVMVVPGYSGVIVEAEEGDVSEEDKPLSILRGLAMSLNPAAYFSKFPQ